MPDERIVEIPEGYIVSGFFTSEDATKEAHGAIAAFRVDGEDYIHLFSSKEDVTKGYGYSVTEKYGVNAIPVDKLNVIKDATNAVRVFITKNGSVTIKKGETEIYNETITDDCNCNLPEFSNTIYFAFDKNTSAYVDFAVENAKKINHSLNEDETIVSDFTEITNTQKSNNSVKDATYLGEILADKLRTYELFNNKKLIVAVKEINTISLSQLAWNKLAETVFEQASLSDDDILITIPYVHCSGIGNDLGEYFYMPGIASGTNVTIDFNSLKSDYINTQRVAQFATTELAPIGEFVFDVFKFTTKKAIVYRAMYHATNSVEVAKYESNAISGKPYNKTILLYRQNGYSELAKLVSDGKEYYQSAKTEMYKILADNPGTYSVIDIAKTLAIIDKDNRLNRYNKIVELKGKTGNEFYKAPDGYNIHFKEEFVDAINPNYSGTGTDNSNANLYVYKDPFNPLRAEIDYELEDKLDWESNHALTGKADYFFDRNDKYIYAGLDVTSVILGFVAADLLPDGLGFFYSIMRGEPISAAGYVASFAFIGPEGIAVKKLTNSVGEGLVKATKDEVVGVISNGTDDVLRKLVSDEFEKGTITNEVYQELIVKSGDDLKQSIDIAFTSSFKKLADKLSDYPNILSKLDGWDNNVAKQKFLSDFNYVSDDVLRKLNDNNGSLCVCWNDLFKAGRTQFAKDIVNLEKFGKLSPEVKVLLIKLSDNVDPTKSSIAKFFCDMDDELIVVLNSNPSYAKGVVGHKEGSLMTKDDFSNLAEELDDFDDISPINKQKLHDAHDRSAGINKFQGFAKLGNDLNKNIKTDLITETGKFKESGHMGALLKEKFPSKTDWHKYDVFEELPLETTNGYMKGDIVLIKKNDFEQIEDVIVIENKLSKTTDLTVRQTEGFGAVKNTSDGLSMKVMYDVENTGGVLIEKNKSLLIKKENCLKISDHTTDKINTLSIDDLKLITEFTF